MPDLKCNLCPFVSDPHLMQAHSSFVHDGQAAPKKATYEEYRVWQRFVTEGQVADDID